MKGFAPPPVLYLPGLFHPTLCADMVDALRETPGRSSGFMWPGEDGVPVETLMPHVKVRDDYDVGGTEFAEPIGKAFSSVLRPAIQRAFRRDVTDSERFLVARYGEGGHFLPHQDDLLPGTFHRRLALTVILQPAEAGGGLEFPGYALPAPLDAGDAIVFSCALEHGIRPVTAGERWAFLTFLYGGEVDVSHDPD